MNSCFYVFVCILDLHAGMFFPKVHETACMVFDFFHKKSDFSFLPILFFRRTTLSIFKKICLKIFFFPFFFFTIFFLSFSCFEETKDFIVVFFLSYHFSSCFTLSEKRKYPTKIEETFQMWSKIFFLFFSLILSTKFACFFSIKLIRKRRNTRKM